MDSTSWNEVLTDDATEQPAETEAQAAETQRLRDEATGRFKAAEPSGDEATQEAPAEPPQAAAAPQDTDTSHIPVAALRDERQKRQAAEERSQQLEAFINGLQAQQQPQYAQPAEVPDMYTDPAGYTQWVAAQVRESIMQEVQQYGQQFSTTTRAEVSELQARQRFSDYDTVIEGSFTEAVRANPMLVQQLAQSRDPATFAYNTGRQWEQAKQFGGETPVSRDEIKAQIRQELLDELGMSNAQPKAPTSLASARSVGNRTGPAWSGPTSFADILNP